MDTGQEPGHEPGLGGSHSAPVRGLVLKHVSHTTPGIICQRQTQSELITDDIIHNTGDQRNPIILEFRS